MIDRYLDELERELRLAADRPVRLTVARAPRPPAGAVGGTFAVAVCVLVAFLLLQTRGARQASPSPSAPAPAVVPAGARALVRELGVFRRPQSAADRINTPIPHLFVLEAGPGVRPGTGPQNLRVVPSLTRMVARLPGGRRIFLAIGRVAGLDSIASQPPTGFGNALTNKGPAHFKVPAPHYDVVWLVLPFANYVPIQGGQGARPVPVGRGQPLLASPALTASTLLERGQSSSPPEGIPDDPITRPMTGPKTWLDIVPDAVVRARWTIQYPGRRRRVVKTLPVSDNVALVRVPKGQQDLVWSLTWLAADGHAIQTKSYPSAFQ